MQAVKAQSSLDFLNAKYYLLDMGFIRCRPGAVDSPLLSDTTVHIVPKFSFNFSNYAQIHDIGRHLIAQSKRQSGTLGYSWLFNLDYTEMVHREWYDSAQAWLDHSTEGGALIAKLLPLVKIEEFEIHGPASELQTLRNVPFVQSLNPKFYEIYKANARLPLCKN